MVYRSKLPNKMLFSVLTLECSMLLAAVFLLPLSIAQYMTECDRGVKRPHPRQENAFQIYVLNEDDSKWIDRFCPAPKIFQPLDCMCGLIVGVDTTSAETTTSATTSASVTPPPLTQRRQPWFSKAKVLQKNQLQHPPQQREQQQLLQQPHLQPDRQPQQQDGLGEKHRKRPVLRLIPQMTSQEVTSSSDGQDIGPIREVVECIHHRPRNGSSGQYEQWTEGGWLLIDCNWPVNSGLVWSQELCRCDWGPERIIAQPDLNGVPAGCLMLLKMTFDDGSIKDVGRGLWLDLRHPYNMEAIRDSTAVGGWAGAFRGAGVSVPFFKMNTLGSTFRIKFRFQLCDGQPDTDLMLINNGCVESDHLPSLQVSYRAWTNVLAFQMATINSVSPFREECHVHSQDPWTDVNIHYDKVLLDIFVNGQHCIRSTAFTGPIVQTDCPFTLLEDNFCGLLDEVVLTRGCTPEQES